MIISEINKQNWKVDKNLKEVSWYVQYIPREEQELHLNFSREDNCIYVDCSWQAYILALSKSSFFTLQEAIYSTKTKEKFILSIKGRLEIKGFSIRKNRRVLSKKEIVELKERAKKYLVRK